ncbi:hypothetical protein C8Q80DRAFT_28516 [Daedaleopsis nitida]|nr:hypothetical protein C8Q80DRAFT_28516 [Daedaleopsis nitida]
MTAHMWARRSVRNRRCAEMLRRRRSPGSHAGLRCIRLFLFLFLFLPQRVQPLAMADALLLLAAGPYAPRCVSRVLPDALLLCGLVPVLLLLLLRRPSCHRASFAMVASTQGRTGRWVAAGRTRSARWEVKKEPVESEASSQEREDGEEAKAKGHHLQLDCPGGVGRDRACHGPCPWPWSRSPCVCRCRISVESPRFASPHGARASSSLGSCGASVIDCPQQLSQKRRREAGPAARAAPRAHDICHDQR